MDGFGYSMFLSRALMEDDAWFDLLYLRILAPDPVDLCGNSTFLHSLIGLSTCTFFCPEVAHWIKSMQESHISSQLETSFK